MADDKPIPKDAIGERSETLLKAFFFGAETSSDSAGTNSLADASGEEQLYSNGGAIPPPYDVRSLMMLLEHSNALRQNLDAYITNIDGFGHRLEPVIDLEGEDAFDAVRDQMVAERARLNELNSAAQVPLLPTDLEVEQRTETLRDAMRVERIRAESFFENCAGDLSLVQLRRRIRQDLELTGNAFIEVVRTVGGDIAEFVHLPTFSVRLRKVEGPFEVNVKIRGADLQYRTEKRRRRFRTYVQVADMRTMFFKEFGDPDTISSKTGARFPSIDAMHKADTEGADIRPATEIIHLSIYASRSAYGIPRWIGNLVSVLGSRSAEEVNYLFFENKSVPPLAVLVSGGRFTAESVKRIEDYVKTEIRGKKNFHKILVLEAEGGSGTSLDGAAKMRIELKPLPQSNEGTHQAYDERNIDKVGQSFRLPRMLRGDVRDFNRATADAALEFAETQVFAPERNDFDHLINHKILAEQRIRYWRFVSNGPTAQDASELAIIIERLVKADVLIPEEAREVAEKILGKQLRRLDADWVKQPVSFTKLGIALDTAEDNQLMTPPTPDAPRPAGAAPEGTPGVPTQQRDDSVPQAFMDASRPKLASRALGKAYTHALALMRTRELLKGAEVAEARAATKRAQASASSDTDPERS